MCNELVQPSLSSALIMYSLIPFSSFSGITSYSLSRPTTLSSLWAFSSYLQVMLAHLCHCDSNPPHLLTAAHVQFVVSCWSFIILSRIAAHDWFVVDCWTFIFLLWIALLFSSEYEPYIGQTNSLPRKWNTVETTKRLFYILVFLYQFFQFKFTSLSYQCTDFFESIFLIDLIIQKEKENFARFKKYPHSKSVGSYPWKN